MAGLLSAMILATHSETVGTRSASSFAQEFVADGAEPLGVLLLRNGNLFRGRISHLGDRFTVLLATRNEVRFAASEVAFHGATPDDAYRFKRSQLPPGQVNDRLNLAEWCLRYGLLRQAAEEVTVALRLEPSHPRIPGLEARIEASLVSPAARGASPSLTPARPPTNQQAKVSVPVAQRERAVESPATPEQLESLARELPTGTLERFTAVIQPMLVNRCGANHCHGASGDTDYRLHRWSLGASATRRYTLRNLHATMRYVDREAPANSELLRQAARPHGGANSVPLPPGEATQLAMLRNWTQLAAQSRSSPLPATIANREARPLQSLPASGSSNATAPAAATAPSPSPTTNPKNPAMADEPRESPTLPRDPFDPEIFNRRFGDKASP